MKLNKILLSVALLLGLSNCGGVVSNSKSVQINSLSATVNEVKETKPIQTRKYMHHFGLNDVDLFDDDDDDDEFDIIENQIITPHTHYHLNENGDKVKCEKDDCEFSQYTLMYKNESELKFTIKLDNPKGESIDAVQLSCTDPNAQILVDNVFKPINYQNGSRILNWAQEDPYEKTYTIKTESQEQLTTIKIIDLKVNGEWQEAKLKHDQLNVYKMELDDINTEFFHNSFEEYKCKFINSDKVNELKIDYKPLIASGNTHSYDPSTQEFIAKTDGVLVWSFGYSVGDIMFDWNGTKPIELFDIKFDSSQDNILIIPQGIQTCHYLTDSLKGTDIDFDHVKVTYKNKTVVVQNLHPTVVKYSFFGLWENKAPNDLPELDNKWGNASVELTIGNTIYTLKYGIYELFFKEYVK